VWKTFHTPPEAVKSFCPWAMNMSAVKIKVGGNIFHKKFVFARGDSFAPTAKMEAKYV
jgi:hypothetical protein